MRFMIFGDSKGKDNGINKRVLEGILQKAFNLLPSPKFIVMCGDTIAGSNYQEILNTQYGELRSLIQKYFPSLPLFPIIGNHEASSNSTDNMNEKVFSKVYNDLYADNFLEGYNKTVYYADINDTRLIILNAFHAGLQHKLDHDQLTWFEKSSLGNMKNKLVFIHSPAYPTGAHLGHCLDSLPESRNAFWRIVLKNNIDIVFSGHEHNYSRRIIGINNKIFTHQIITGGGGEKLKDKFKSKEGVIKGPIAEYHFIIVDTEAHYTKATSISINGKILDEFTLNKPALY